MPKTVVVTGASGGIGRATAVASPAAVTGWRCSPAARRGLTAAAEDVRAAGGTPLVVPVDIADADAVDAAADRVERELGEIDVWVNVAFTAVFATFAEVSAAEYRRVTEVTYLGFVHGTHGRAGPDAARATAASSCRPARRWPTAASRCRAPTAAPSTR